MIRTYRLGRFASRVVNHHMAFAASISYTTTSAKMSTETKSGVASPKVAEPTKKNATKGSSLSERYMRQQRQGMGHTGKDHRQPRAQQQGGYSTPRRNNNNQPWQNKQRQQRRNKDPSASPSPRKLQHNDPPAQVFESSFAAFHKSCKAARYKVHKPGCTCSKINSLRLRQRVKVKDEPSLTDQMEQLTVEDKLTVEDQPKKQNADDSNPTMDGLIVLPDIKFIHAVYRCSDTPLASFDRIKDEKKLRREMFHANDDDDVDFKVSCAQCLLQDEPNGFVCVASSNKDEVVRVRDMALVQMKTKEEVGLHADHAHFLAVISQEALLRHDSRRRGNDSSPAAKTPPPSQIVKELQEQHIIPQDELATISFGHHLKSLLGTARKKATGKNKKPPSYWFVLVYKDPNYIWSLDLPGGKRHLGETAIECAIRETEEESSLIWSGAEWVADQVTANHDECNLYFLLKQPATEVLSTQQN